VYISDGSPVDFIDGFGRGLASLTGGLTKAVTGVVKEPIVGGRKHGVKGFVKGMAKGVGGVVLHPIHGVLGLIHHTSQGVMTLSGISFSYPPPQVRYPRYFSSSFAVTNYDLSAAKANYIFRYLRIALNRNEEYVHHRFVMNSSDSHVIVITTKRIFCVRSNMEDDTHVGRYKDGIERHSKEETLVKKAFVHVPKNQSYELNWEFSISDIREIIVKKRPKEIGFILHGEKKKSFASSFFDYFGLSSSSVISSSVQTSDQSRVNVIDSPVLLTPYNDENAVLDVKRVIETLMK
jgi:hypothetical protein